MRTSTYSARRPVAGLALLMALVGTVALAGADRARANGVGPPGVVSITVTPTSGSTAGGFLTLAIDVRLVDQDGMPDAQTGASAAEGAAVATRTGTGDAFPGRVVWESLHRVSGTSTDGVWRGLVTVSPAWAGSYRVTSLVVRDNLGSQGRPSFDAPAFSVGGVQAWRVVSTTAALRVVTGDETYVPNVEVRDRATGAPVNAWLDTAGVDSPPLWLLARRTEPPGVRVGVDGAWGGRPVAVTAADPLVALAYGQRGTRGWSLEAGRCVQPTVKWMANARFAAPGETLVVTGNVWPAPAVLALPGRLVYLQRRSATGTWQTVATAWVRDNGRYTLTWTPGRGAHTLRVRKPGASGGDCPGGSVGTNLRPLTIQVTAAR